MQYDLNLNNLKPFSDLNISIPFLKKLNDLILQENTRHISALVLFHTHILLNLTLRGNSLKQNIPELANLIKKKAELSEAELSQLSEIIFTVSPAKLASVMYPNLKHGARLKRLKTTLTYLSQSSLIKTEQMQGELHFSISAKLIKLYKQNDNEYVIISGEFKNYLEHLDCESAFLTTLFLYYKNKKGLYQDLTNNIKQILSNKNISDLTSLQNYTNENKYKNLIADVIKQATVKLVESNYDQLKLFFTYFKKSASNLSSFIKRGLTSFQDHLLKIEEKSKQFFSSIINECKRHFADYIRPYLNDILKSILSKKLQNSKCKSASIKRVNAVTDTILEPVEKVNTIVPLEEQNARILELQQLFS